MTVPEKSGLVTFALAVRRLIVMTKSTQTEHPSPAPALTEAERVVVKAKRI